MTFPLSLPQPSQDTVMNDKRTTPDIPESHIAFARELVALARRHSMNHLRVEFDHSGTANWRNEPSHIVRLSKTQFSWEEGRHGAKTRISMSREETAIFEEIEPAAAEGTQS